VVSLGTPSYQPVTVDYATIRSEDTAPKTTSEFQITVDYATSVDGPVPMEIRAVCEKVATRWSEVIIGDLPP
jgi:hypothetical protein